MEVPDNQVKSSRPQSHAQIMVVENEDFYRKGIAEKLRQAGYKVAVAPNIEEARRTFSDNRTSLKLLLLDVELADESKNEHNTRHNNGFDWVNDEMSRYRSGNFPKVIFISRLDVRKRPDGMVSHPIFSTEPSVFFGDTMVGGKPKPFHVLGESAEDHEDRKNQYLRSFTPVVERYIGPPVRVEGVAP